MKRMSRGLIARVVLVVLVVVFVAGSFYYYSKYGNSGINGGPDNTKLLGQSKQKVATEMLKLDELNRKQTAENAEIAKIQNEYLRIKNTILRRTDILFDNPDSNNPRFLLKIGDRGVEDDINTRRLQITKLMNAWNKKIATIKLDQISKDLLPTLPDMVKSARDDFVYVQVYINELSDIIDGLSPSNSNVTQAQIITYRNIIELNLNQTEETLAAIAQIETTVALIYQPVTGSGTTTAVQSVVETNTTLPAEPVVTPSQIQTQQDAVDEAEAEQEAIEHEISGESLPENPDVPDTAYEPPVHTQLNVLDYIVLPEINYIGWPDLSPSDNPDRSMLLEGSNKL